MHECEYAPMALVRAKTPASSESASFSNLFYFASQDETPQQLKYLKDFNWLCVPDDTLSAPHNNTLKGVAWVENETDADPQPSYLSEEDESAPLEQVRPWG